MTFVEMSFPRAYTALFFWVFWYFVFFVFCTLLLSKWEFPPMGNSGRFSPSKSQLQQSRATQP